MAYLYAVSVASAGTVEVVPFFGLSVETQVRTRFYNWTPSFRDISDKATSMSTGRIAATFTYRTESRVSFEMRHIGYNGPTGASGLNPVENALRLMRHAENGGEFVISVQDDLGTPDRMAYITEPMVLTLYDPKHQLFSLSVNAIGLTSAPWRAIYGGAR